MAIPSDRKKREKLKSLYRPNKNLAGGLGDGHSVTRDNRTEDCDFTYDGYVFNSGPYHDCRDSCQNFGENAPDWCDSTLPPCDYYIFVSDVYTSKENGEGNLPYGKFNVSLSFFPTSRADATIGPVNNFQLAMDYCSDRPLVTASNIDNGGVVGHVENPMYPMLDAPDCEVPGDSALGLQCDDFPGHMAVQTMRAHSDWLSAGEHEFYLKWMNVDLDSVQSGQNINYFLNQDCSCVSSVVAGVSTAEDAVQWAPYDTESYPVDVYNLAHMTLSYANVPGESAYKTIYPPSGAFPDWMGPYHNVPPASGECTQDDSNEDGVIDCMNLECFGYGEDDCNLDDSCQWLGSSCVSVAEDYCGPWTCGGDYGSEFAIGGAKNYATMCCYGTYDFQGGTGCLPYGYSTNTMDTTCGAGGDDQGGGYGMHEQPNQCDDVDGLCLNSLEDDDWGWTCGGIIESQNEKFCRDKYLGEYVGDTLSGYIDPVGGWHKNLVAAYWNCLNGNHECYSSEWEQECTWCADFYHCAQGSEECQEGGVGYPGTITQAGAVWKPDADCVGCNEDLSIGSRILKIDIARNFYCHPDNWDANEDAATQGCVSRLFHVISGETEPANFAFLPSYINLDLLSELSASEVLTPGHEYRDSILHNFYLDNLWGCNDPTACSTIWPASGEYTAYNPFTVENPNDVCHYNNGVYYREDTDEDGWGIGPQVQVCHAEDLPDHHCTTDPTHPDIPVVTWSPNCDQTDDVNPNDPCDHNHYDGCGYCNPIGVNDSDVCGQAPDGTFDTWNEPYCPNMNCDGSCSAGGSAFNGNWDECGECNGNNESLQGCGCGNPAPTAMYMDTDGDGLVDGDFSECGHYCYVGHCDGTVLSCYDVDTLDQWQSEYNIPDDGQCIPLTDADPYPLCDGCTDVCGECWTGTGCDPDGNGNCTATCTGSSYSEGIAWCGASEGNSCCDCAGNNPGSVDYDLCGVCGGDNTSCCSGNGTAYEGAGGQIYCECIGPSGGHNGYCPSGAAADGNRCAYERSDDDLECDPSNSIGLCQTEKPTISCDGGTSTDCCPTGMSSGELAGNNLSCDCNNECGGSAEVDCCGVCEQLANYGDSCEDACGTICDEATWCLEHHANSNSSYGYNLCWGRGSSSKKYAKSCVDIRWPGPGNYVPYKSSQRFRISNAHAGFDDDCYSLWSITDENDGYCSTGCTNGLAGNISVASGYPSAGNTFQCNKRYSDALDTSDDNPCSSTPSGNFGGEGCDCCCAGCGGYGPSSYPYASGNTCPTYNANLACTDASFMFGGQVSVATKQHVDNFDFD